MKPMLAVSAALFCVMLITTSVQAQPEAKPQPTTVSLRLDNATVAEVVKAIAQQGDVQVLVQGDGTGTVQKFVVDKMLPAAALEQLAQAAHLTLTKIADQTFMLAATPAPKPQPAPVVATPAIAAPINSYVIRVRLGNGLTQDIQVALCGAFHVTTTLDKTQWTVKGTNKLDEDRMQVDLSVERLLTTPTNFVARQFLHTQFVTRPDGQEMKVSDAGFPFPVVASVEPVVLAAK